MAVFAMVVGASIAIVSFAVAAHSLVASRAEDAEQRFATSTIAMVIGIILLMIGACGYMMPMLQEFLSKQ